VERQAQQQAVSLAVESAQALVGQPVAFLEMQRVPMTMTFATTDGSKKTSVAINGLIWADVPLLLVKREPLTGVAYVLGMEGSPIRTSRQNTIRSLTTRAKSREPTWK
jgi:hypothetical protein